MVLIHYNVIDILIVPLNTSTVYHILEMFVVGIVFGRLRLFVSISIVGSLFPFCKLLNLSDDPRLAISLIVVILDGTFEPRTLRQPFLNAVNRV